MSLLLNLFLVIMTIITWCANFLFYFGVLILLLGELDVKKKFKFLQFLIKMFFWYIFSCFLIKKFFYGRDITSIIIFPLWRCPWCNGYRRRKWTRRHEFKPWRRLIAFHIALIPLGTLGKVWIPLFSHQLWVNSRTDWFLQPCWGN